MFPVMPDPRIKLDEWVLRSWERDGAVLPAFPIAATRLVDALESPDVEVNDIRQLIAQDPALTSEVIRIANSVLYRGVSPVEDVAGAIMRLGFRETANVAMSAACRSLFAMEDRAEFEVFEEVWGALWASSLIGAYGARIVAAESKLGDPEQIFQAAMFRDVGWLVILKLVAAGLVRGKLRTRPEDADLEWLLAARHEHLGADYLRKNRLPGYVVRAAEQHHQLELSLSHDTIQAHVLCVMDGLCDQLGVSPFATGELGAPAQQSAELLGLTETRLEYFALQIEGIREQVSDLM